jgi:hypothetical protein
MEVKKVGPLFEGKQKNRSCTLFIAQLINATSSEAGAINEESLETMKLIQHNMHRLHEVAEAIQDCLQQK